MWSSQESTEQFSTRSGTWSWRVQAAGSPFADKASTRILFCHREALAAMMYRRLDPGLPDLSLQQVEVLSHMPDGRLPTTLGVEVTIRAVPRPPVASARNLSGPPRRPERLLVSVKGKQTVSVSYEYDEALGDLTDEELLDVIEDSGLVSTV
jgi:hypothetical protein